MNTVVVHSQKELTSWRIKIETAWQKSVASVIEVGRLVKEAKGELGVSYSLLETELPFSSTVAAFLIKIAENPVLSNPAYFSRLPNAYNTLYHLASVDPKKLVQQIESGEINPSYTLASAKTLRDASPTKSLAKVPNSKKPKVTLFEVGTLSIAEPRSTEAFQAELDALIQKYKGSITYTGRQNSLLDWHRHVMLNQALEKIKQCESELTNIDIDDLRMLEDAAFFLTKDKNQKYKSEIVINGELVTRTCLSPEYKDYKRISKLIKQKDITKGSINEWCKENKVPNQFTDLKSMDKEFYIWEQVRLILEKKDIKGSLKRLNDMASRSRFPKIRTLGQKVLKELTRFDNKA
ncbi:hypothetical protein [Polynucleobacter sp. P1-05-14]|uniref:hypothetical protein n=1 Tax=Polynucleobacter sp. P1-05-14 TaxID=1819732 RepID=UPI001C0C9E05|nr:hypothetical protein [Polynucleobacter sp. P1-05-14]MBU3549479.1 hypothetical protein [Polynucleobacter sp. P1-05-14]